MNFNRVVLVGRATHDPDVRYSAGGILITKFTLAVQRRRKDDKTDFIRVTTFGRLAEVMRDYLTKGKLVLVEGELHTHRWKDETGQSHTHAEVVANVVRFLEKKTDRNEEAQKDEAPF